MLYCFSRLYLGIGPLTLPRSTLVLPNTLKNAPSEFCGRWSFAFPPSPLPLPSSGFFVAAPRTPHPKRPTPLTTYYTPHQTFVSVVYFESNAVFLLEALTKIFAEGLEPWNYFRGDDAYW